MRRYGLLLISILVAALFVRLGVWQLARLKQRQAVNARLIERLDQPPVDLNEALPDSLYFRHAIAQGVYDFDHQVVVTNRTQGGLPGVYVVTPLRLPSGRTVLVERGWMYSPDGRSVNIDATREPADATVGGVIMEAPTSSSLSFPSERTTTTPDVWPKAVSRLDLTRLTLSYPPITAVLRLVPAVGNGGPAGVEAIPIPPLDNGPHLSYALQWFAFALIALIGGAVWARGERGTRNAERGVDLPVPGPPS